MVKDLSTSLKAALYERVNAPVVGTYTVTWLFYNWKGVIPLIFGGGQGGEKLSERVEAFDAYLHTSTSWGWLNWLSELIGLRLEIFLFPALLTLIAIYILPIIQAQVFKHNEKLKAKSLKYKEQNDSELRLTLEQSKEMRKELASYHEINEQQRERLNAIHKRDYDNLRDENEALVLRENQEVERREKVEKDLVDSQEGFNSLYENNKELMKSQTAALEDASIAAMAAEEFRRKLERYENGQVVSKKIESVLFNIIHKRNLNDLDEFYSFLRSVSDNKEWISSLNSIITMKYTQVATFDEADGYFLKLIKPRITTYSIDNLKLLDSVWQKNDQIYGRRRSDDDLNIVHKRLEELEAEK
ncbi:hypothetical protein [Marinomonas sp. TW1]|uniref:hypothetical protein n=1 Tax=Marinomonas sp. TW1 TaxID=1561203 RepID=UPI0007AF378C|nr:hypothetical protein [Marinomonas sp. TW1]KZN15187.1 hypothetical protein OA79_03045 [Marinomonas sp. TW1]